MSFVCEYCGKTFTQKINVKRHIVQEVCRKNCHPCFCGKSFRSLHGLERHQRRRHFSNPRVVHKDTTLLQFKSFTEFTAWKECIENKTVSKFVKNSGTKKRKDGSRMLKYICHHSVIRLKNNDRSRDDQNGAAHAALSGRCLAFMKVEEKLDGSVKVLYNSIHCNHQIKSQTYAETEKENIFDNWKQRVPFDRMLDNILQSVHDEEEENVTSRIQLLTTNELRNIAQQFKIFSEKCSQVSQDDAVSVDLLVRECNKRFGAESPIKYYKPRNSVSADFILIIVTPVQKYMLTQFGRNKICIDRTYGTYLYDFHLTTVLTGNDFNPEIPAAFCFSSKQNEEIMSKFFSIIKKECGNIRSTVFMSDNYPASVNAWCKVKDLLQFLILDKFWKQVVYFLHIT